MKADQKFLAGGGELGAMMRAHDWERTPLGPPARWPRSLKTAVRIMLTSQQPFWLGWGPELTYLYNDAYKSIIGGKHPHALGRPFREVWREIWDVVGPMADTVMNRDQGTYVEAQLLIMERHGYPEETYYTFSYSPVPDDQGGPGGLICANTDDTRRVIGERQLGTLRELAARTAPARTRREACALAAQALATNPRDLPFAIVYAEGAPVAASGLDLERAARLPFGEASAAPALVELDGTHGELPGGAWERPPAQAAVIPMAASGDAGRAGVLVAGLNPFRKFDAGYRGFLELVAGQIAAAIANAHAYEEASRRAEALAELDRAKTAFFSNVSHEFRTPLTLMLGPVEDLLAQPGFEGNETLRTVRRNGQRLLKLVNTLLDFSRIEAGRTQASYEPTDLGTLTAELASNFRSACERAGLALEVDCPPLAEAAWVDREMWEKIVLNLVSNAFKFTLEGGIRVSMGQQDAAFELVVRDTGSGIPEEAVPRMFERFHRVEGARGRSHEGSGIGLALVQELVKLHGGSIGVDSRPGAGSVFTVRLPRGSAHLPAGRIKAGRAAVSTALRAGAYVDEAMSWLPGTEQPAAAGQTGQRVLLADDNADLREYARRLLAEHYEVEAVADGEAALAAARARRPDLVVSDVMMPRLDGFGLVRELRADPALRTLPVILLSARAGEEARIEGMGRGADDYLVKPFSARELLVRVGALLQSAHVRREAEDALRESERRYREVLEGQSEMVCRFRMDGTILFVNGAYARARGTTAAALEGGNFWDFVAAGDRAAVRAELERLTPQAPEVRVENRFETAGGERWTLWTNRALAFDAAGRVLEAQSSGIDITERKQMEAALREADRAKDEFLATLSHELRNPLAPLRNSLHLLRQAGAGGRAEPIHEMMERQVNHLVRLVDDLMETSRIARGSFELRREPVELQALLRNALETSEPLIAAAQHRLSVSLPEAPIVLEADPVRLAQVFANLLNNAARYTPPGGAVSVAARREGGEAVVEVADTGEGIEPAELPRLFEMFSQGNRTARRSQGGLGIGLALARRLLEMHGGNVRAESAGRDRGSRFTVRLPLGPAAPALPERGSARPEQAAPPRRVLVVDDNRDAANSLGMLLKFLGADVAVAHDGPGALEAFESYRPAIVLLDIGMPGMNGYDVARAIRGRPAGRGVPLIALTGWGQEEDRRRAREAGFDHHLIKPADIGALQSLLSGLALRALS